MRTLTIAVSLAAGLTLTTIAGNAQVVGIAAVVNDDVISALDVENRLQFSLMSETLPDNLQTRRRLGPQVLRTLIDEKLQIQESERLNITIDDADLSDAQQILEFQNSLPTGSLYKFLRSRGIDQNTLKAKIHAEIAWGKVIRRRVLTRIDISDEEVDEVFDRLQARQGVEQRLMSEIFLTVDSQEQSESVFRQAQRLVDQIRNGSPFAAIAQQFSHGVTSRVGGDVGWVSEGELPADRERVLSSLSEGEVSDPIPSPGGFYILQLRDRRRLGEASALDSIVNLKQIFIPLTPTTPNQIAESRMADAQRISANLNDCATFDTYGQTLEFAESGDLGEIRLGDVPQLLRDAINDLAIGQASQPLRMQEGIRILMVCGRKEAQAALLDREVIRERLGRQRLDMMARRYLRDLRRDAVIEIR